jgi:uncharacterized YceG family protein
VSLPLNPAEPDGAPGSQSELDWDRFLGGAAAANNAASHSADPADASAGSSEPPVPAAPQGRRAARNADNRRSTRSSRRAQLSNEPPREKRSRKGAWGCLVVVLVFLALLGAGAVALQGPLSQFIASTQGPADYPGTGDKKIVVMIHEGENGSDIANTLVANKVVKSYEAFYNLLLKETPAPVFQPGAYQLATQMSARSALDALLDPANRLKQTVVVPEGTAAVDVLQLVSEGTDIPLADLQAAAADVGSFGLPPQATTLEGFLFPATYTFTPGISAHEAIKTMVDRQFTALDDAHVAPENRWSTIVLASLVQREAGLHDDYFKVARVFLNRLDPAKWPSGLLQSDATVAYGTGNTHRVTTTDAERADANNRYNTYVHPGLPVGPISNPGDLAIDAALHPADGPWLYFVTWNLDTGETIFSTTEAEHEAAVAKWLAWMDEHPEYG